MNFPADPDASCREEKDLIPSVPRSLKVKLPSGSHLFEVLMTGIGGAVNAEVLPEKISPAQPPLTKEEKTQPEQKVYGIEPTLSLGYDSNIIQLSPSDLDLFRNNRGYTPQNTNIQRIDSNIKSTDDFPIIFELVGNAQGRPWKEKKTFAELKGHAYFFPKNVVKFYGDAGIAFAQELPPGPQVRVSYIYQTKTYLRNLSYFNPLVPGISFSLSSYRKAWFQSHTAGLSLSQPLKEIFILNAGYTFKTIIFREVFKERNSFIHRGFGGIEASPWGPLKLRIEGSYEMSLARGDIRSTPRKEADTSYSQAGGSVMAGIDLKRLGWANLFLDAEGSIYLRSFTTGDSLDLLHYDRQDALNSFTGRVIYRMSKNWALGATYSFILVNSNVGLLPSLEQKDEATSYREDTAFLNIIFTPPRFGPPVK